jgi:hypothetical protein
LNIIWILQLPLRLLQLTTKNAARFSAREDIILGGKVSFFLKKINSMEIKVDIC